MQRTGSGEAHKLAEVLAPEEVVQKKRKIRGAPQD